VHKKEKVARDSLLSAAARFFSLRFLTLLALSPDSPAILKAISRERF